MQSIKKAPRMSGVASNRKLSLGRTILVQTPTIDRHDFLKATPHASPVRKSDQVHLNGQLNPPLDNFVGPFPVGKGGNDITGPFIKNNSIHEPESPMVRKPFSPLSSTTSVKADRRISSLDEANLQVEGVQKILPSCTALTTPVKAIPAEKGGANSNSRQAFDSFSPMHTVITPNSLPAATPIMREIPEEAEYSFVEQRAGFVLPGTMVKSMIHF